jgi:hypothetical protein
VSESAEERLTAWLWEDERLTAGLEDFQAGVLLQWAADQLLRTSAQDPQQLPRLTAALRSVFVAARRADVLPSDLAGWADAALNTPTAAPPPEDGALVPALLPEPAPVAADTLFTGQDLSDAAIVASDVPSTAAEPLSAEQEPPESAEPAAPLPADCSDAGEPPVPDEDR